MIEQEISYAIHLEVHFLYCKEKTTLDMQQQFRSDLNTNMNESM